MKKIGVFVLIVILIAAIINYFGNEKDLTGFGSKATKQSKDKDELFLQAFGFSDKDISSFKQMSASNIEQILEDTAKKAANKEV